jgi:hypothetical protein
MHDHVGRRDAEDDQPGPTTGRVADVAAVQVPTGDWDTSRNQLLQRGEARRAREACLDAVAGQGPDLCCSVGGVATCSALVVCDAEVADPGQVLIVTLELVRTPGFRKARSMAQLEEKHIRRA